MLFIPSQSHMKCNWSTSIPGKENHQQTHVSQLLAPPAKVMRAMHLLGTVVFSSSTVCHAQDFDLFILSFNPDLFFKKSCNVSSCVKRSGCLESCSEISGWILPLKSLAREVCLPFNPINFHLGESSSLIGYLANEDSSAL